MTEQLVEQWIEITVDRYQPKTNKNVTVSYTIPFEQGMTYMDSLRYIADEIDESFAFYEHSCKRGFCGSCLINVNGKKVLSCRTLLINEQPIYIKPAMEVAKDFYPKL